MDIENQKELALKYCMDIATDYTEEEVKRFTPPSVQEAWRVGRDFIDYSISVDREKLKDFAL